tara:strand:- start:36 stop:785 length:750 start_codon:yes stop_codon:yes gene_type:complete
MEEVYLTDEITIYNSKFYYKEKKLIGNKKWLEILDKCGWEKLDTLWIRRLNKYREKKSVKTKWGILDTNNDGDCFFNVIAEAFNYYNKIHNNDILYDCQDIRKKISNEINEKNFEEIMMFYNIEKINGEFNNKWDINKINTYQDLRNELIKTGHNYWADFIIMQLTLSAFNINIILLNEPKDIPTNRCKIYPFGNDLDINKKSIIIYYYNNNHFKLIGYYDNHCMNTIFEYKDLPKEIITVYEMDSRKI